MGLPHFLERGLVRSRVELETQSLIAPSSINLVLLKTVGSLVSDLLLL